MYYLSLNTTYLDKQWDAVQAADHGPVVRLAGQDVQCAHGALHDVLHAHAVHDDALAGPALHVLVRAHEQLDQARQAAVLADRRVVGWAQGQVPH